MGSMKIFKTLFWIVPIYSCALFVGNPSEPTFFQQGVILEETSKYSLRTGYLSEYVFDAMFLDEFDTTFTSRSNATLSTYAGMAIFSLFSRWDIYAIMGASKLTMDEIIETNRTLSWSFGSKATLWQGKVVSIGIDAKFFGTNQKPDYFCVNGRVRPIEPPFKFELRQFQAAALAGFQMGYFVPYFGITYLWSKITPTPVPGILVFPELNNLKIEFDSEPMINHKKIGGVFGATLVQEEQMTLNVEARIIDEKAINISGELRF